MLLSNENKQVVGSQVGATEANSLGESGIDISHYQGKIDWKKVASFGVKRVFMKMTEGGTYIDPEFMENWSGAQDSGLKIGVYHYFRALTSTPQAQYENIIKNLTAVKFDPALHWLAIDVEEGSNQTATPEQMADVLHGLLSLLAKEPLLGNILPLIYCFAGYWDRSVKWSRYDFSVYPLWVANWGVAEPRLPLSWKNTGQDWLGWQYSDKGVVDGIQGAVDLNWFRER